MISVTSYAVCALHINAIIASVFASIEFQWNDQPSLCLEKKKFVENESFQIYSVCTYSPLLLLVVVVMVPVTICLVTNLNEYTDNIRIDAIDPDVETNFHLRKSYVSANRQKKLERKIFMLKTNVGWHFIRQKNEVWSFGHACMRFLRRLEKFHVYSKQMVAFSWFLSPSLLPLRFSIQ